MSQQTKKTANPKIAELIKETEEKVKETGRKGLEECVHAADKASHMAEKLMQACSDNFAACVESNSVVVNAMKELNDSVIEDVSQMCTDYMEFSKETWASRSMKDLIETQKSLFNNRVNSYFKRSDKWFNLLFDGCKDALEPIETQVATNSAQIRKAMAA